MTQAVQCAFIISRRWRRTAVTDGVVLFVSTSTPGYWTPSVPIRPTGPGSSCARRCAVVVLPFVPVTPMTGMRRDGSLYRRSASLPAATRTSSTLSQRTAGPGSRSETTATAPRSSASRAYSIPSLRVPAMARKRSPGPHSRESSRTPRTASRSPAFSSYPSARAKSPSFQSSVRTDVWDIIVPHRSDSCPPSPGSGQFRGRSAPPISR